MVCGTRDLSHWRAAARFGTFGRSAAHSVLAFFGGCLFVFYVIPTRIFCSGPTQNGSGTDRRAAEHAAWHAWSRLNTAYEDLASRQQFKRGKQLVKRKREKRGLRCIFRPSPTLPLPLSQPSPFLALVCNQAFGPFHRQCLAAWHAGASPDGRPETEYVALTRARVRRQQPACFIANFG